MRSIDIIMAKKFGKGKKGMLVGWPWMMGVAGGTETTVTGVSPLLLAAALHKPIKSLTQYGLCAQASTPTPSSPQNIVCNNGTLKMVHRSGLPDGYRLLEYVGGNGSQYIVTDLYLASTDVIECEYRNSSTTGYGAIYGIYKTGESSALYGNQTYYGYDVSNNKVDTDVRVDTDWHSSRHDFVNGTLAIDNASVSFTPWTFTNSTKNAVLSRYYNGAYGYNWKGYIRKFKVTRGNEVICDLLPAKNSSDVAGLYDLISGNFYTATGGTLLEGNEVDDYELAVVGTPESIAITADGSETQYATAINLLSVGTYADKQEIVGGLVNRKIGIWVFDGTEAAINGVTAGHAYFAFGNSSVPDDKKADPNAPVCVCSHYPAAAKDGQPDFTVSAFKSGSNIRLRFYDSTNITGLGASEAAASFKSYLAAQYAAGTPVIVLYPLATPYTESVTPQTIELAEGDNTITVTANVSPIDFDVTYTKGE